jgi:hypothetical protein
MVTSCENFNLIICLLFERRDHMDPVNQPISILASPILSWPKAVEEQTSLKIPTQARSNARSSTQQNSIESDGLHRARKASRVVAAAVAAAAADRAVSKQTFHGHGGGAINFRGGGVRGGKSGVPQPAQRLTEQALLLHTSRSKARSPLPTATDTTQRRGSRFVADALPFHCVADYLLPGPPCPAVDQRR